MHRDSIHKGLLRSATLVELPISPKEKRVVSPQGATESLVETAELVCITPDGRLDESLRYASAGGEETMMMGDTLKGYAEDVEGVLQADIKSALLSGGGDITTSLLVPVKQQLTPSIENTVQHTGMHNSIPSSNIVDAKTPERMRNEVDEVQVQVLREQSPHPVLDIKDQEDDSIPNQVTTTPVEEDQEENQMTT